MIKKTKQINFRTCVVTREKLPKDQMIRFKWNKFSNEIVLDKEKNMDGRGFYIKKNKTVLKKVLDKKILQNKYKLKDSKYLVLKKELESIIEKEV